MKTRTIIILSAAAVLVLGLGLVFGTGNREQQDTSPLGQLAFPNLAPKLQDAAKLEIARHGSTLRLLRNGAVWGLADRHQYSAAQGKVRALVAALTELKLEEPRTANPGDYARLGVEDPQGKDANSTMLRVLDANGGAIAELIAGHQRGSGIYVRRPGEAQSWLAEGQVSVSAEAMDWIDDTVADVDAVKVASVTVTRDGQTLRFARQNGTMALVAPATHPQLDPFKLEDLTRGLQKLKLTEVQPAPPPGTELGRAVVTTTDGLNITVTVNLSGQDVWLQLAASGDGAAKAAAEALQAKVKGWAYRTAPWTQQAFVPTLDELKAYQPPAPAK